MASVASYTYTRQDGTVTERFRARWRQDNGRQTSKGGFTSKSKAQTYGNQEEGAKHRGVSVDLGGGKTKLADYIEEEWWPTKVLKPKTVASYRAILKLEILPRFGTTQLARITSIDVEQWLVNMKTAGKSASRIRQSKNLLHQILAHATLHRRIAYNPTEGIRAPVTTTKKLPRYITAGEVDQIAAAVPDRYRALVYVLGYLGLRWAEAVGLQRHNIHLLKRRLHIESTLSEVEGEFHRVPPKTHEERDVVLPVFLADELAAHIGRYVEDDPDALVFTSAEGNPIRNSNFRRRVWTLALETAGVEKLTMHQMRHTAASIMAAEGWPLQAVKEQLGHSSILVTADTYSHLFDESRDELAARLDRDHTATGAG